MGLARGIAMGCTLQDAGEFVQARIGPAPSRTLLDCYQELLALCTEHRIERVLVISDDEDGTTHGALEQALQSMSGAGLSHLRLAMVAPSPRAFDLYRSAERFAADNGIAARAFRRRADAVQWLTGRPAGQREMPRP
jgi:hypothetical protein